MADTGERILVIVHGEPARLLQTLGALAAIRRHHDSATITLLTEKTSLPWLENCPFIDQIHIDSMPTPLHIVAAKRLWSWFRKQAFDQVFDLTGTLRTQWYFRLIGRKKPAWNGHISWCSYPYEPAHTSPLHRVDALREQLREAHIMRTPDPETSWLTPDPATHAPPGDYALFLLDTPPEDAPHWHVYGFGDVADWLHERGIETMLAWQDDSCARLARQIITMCRTAKPVLFEQACSPQQLLALGLGARVALGHHHAGIHLLAMRNITSIMLVTDNQPVHLEAPRGDNLIAISYTSLDRLDGQSVIGVLRDTLDG